MKKKYLSLEKSEIEHFDRMAESYDSNYGYRDSFTKYKIHKKANILLDLLSKRLDKKKVRIVEIGCGTGAYTRLIARDIQQHTINAIDISSKIIQIAKEHKGSPPNIKYQVKSVYRLGMKPHSIDIIYGYYILHHLDISKTAKELYKVLKPGGTVFFYEPNILNPIVYLIKSIPFLKKLVGDSPDEWAIDPLSIKNDWKGFKVLKVGITEFIPPIRFIDLKALKLIDKISTSFSFIPILRYFGGSVYFYLEKE